MARAHVALGSNLGDREGTLDAAIEALCRLPGTCVVARSTPRATRPVGGPPQGEFLNAVVEVETRLSPRELLAGLHEIERAFCRVRLERDGPSAADLQLGLMGDLVAAEPALSLPQPRFPAR